MGNFYFIIPKYILTKQNMFGIIIKLILGCRQAVRHQTLTLAPVGSNPAIPARKKQVARLAFFSYIRLRRVLLLRSDIRLTPSDIRFASLGGEYNITAERSGAISLLRKQKYHADEVSISLKTLHFGHFGSVDRFEPSKSLNTFTNL